MARVMLRGEDDSDGHDCLRRQLWNVLTRTVLTFRGRFGARFGKDSVVMPASH